MRVGERNGVGADDAWSTSEDVERRNDVNRINAPTLPLVTASPTGRASRTSHEGYDADAKPLILHPDAFRNPALVRTASAPAAPPANRAPARERPASHPDRNPSGGAPADACATAHPTPRDGTPRRRGPVESSSAAVDYGCVNRGALCLDDAQRAQVEAWRQNACATTGLDPLRFRDVDPKAPAIDVDRAHLAQERAKAALEHLATMRSSVAGSAAYTVARARGVSEDDARAAGRDTAVVVNVAIGVARSIARSTAKAKAPPPTSVQLFDDSTRSWVAKAGHSTLFPPAWSSDRVADEIRTAYRNARPTAHDPAVFEGRSASGVRIQMIVRDGAMITAYPIHMTRE